MQNVRIEVVQRAIGLGAPGVCAIEDAFNLKVPPAEPSLLWLRRRHSLVEVLVGELVLVEVVVRQVVWRIMLVMRRGIMLMWLLMWLLM